MSDSQHVTTRRAFIGTLGFGGVALYGAWAAYGAAPLPFFHSRAFEKDNGITPHQPQAGEGPGGGHGAAGSMTPDDFLRRHEEFMARFRQPDGSVAVGSAEAPPAHATQLPVAGHDMHAMPPPHVDQGGHGTAQRDAGGTAPMHTPSHGSAPAHSQEAQPTDLYLLAYRFGFAPDDIRINSGQPYRFRMMASDITHGASLQLGRGSRIIRLRPNVVVEQTIVFHRPGPVLVYCTTYCGPAHDAMKARILVA